MKKQLLIVGGVLIAALILFGVYEFIIKNDDFTLIEDEFYKLTEPVINEIKKIDDNIDIVFCGVNNKTVKEDEYYNRAYLFALAYSETNSKIDVSFDEKDSFSGIIFKKGDSKIQVAFDELYIAFEDGTRYAFDGESIYTNALLSLSKMQKMENIKLRALEGYDTDGDIVITNTGRPFMYPNTNRQQVVSIAVKNQHGSYRIIKAKDDNFYFEDAVHIGVKADMLSNLIVNTTYVLSLGKVEEPLELSEYGLEDEKDATAVFSVTLVDKTTHKIIIGDKTPDNNSYYAKYDTKDFVYILPASDLESAILRPITDFLYQQLVYGISKEEDLFKVDNINLDFPEDNLTLSAYAHAKMTASSNIKVFGENNLVNTYTNKQKFSGSYTNWTEHSSLGGFSSTNGKSVYLELPLVNYGAEGAYKISFGLLKDEMNSAFLPKSFKIAVSYDYNTTEDIDIDTLSFEQRNKEIKTYTAEFKSDKPVKFVRLYFGIDAGRYIVLDEITVTVDSVDAHPDEGLASSSIWKLVSPEEYIPEGRNYIYPCNEFATSFVTSVSTIIGSEIVDYSITSDPTNPDTLNKSKLAEYGLDNPSKHVSFEFEGVKTDLYFSRPNEDGNYYCYSILSEENKKNRICTDVIAEITTEQAPWITWDIVDFLDSQILSMYIDSIDLLTVTYADRDYAFVLEKGDDGKLSKVTVDGKEVDLKNFRNLYINILRINIKGELEPSDGEPAEVMRITVKSGSRDSEIVFYRVTTNKAYYTIDGQGKYYVLVDSINTVKSSIDLLLAGKQVPTK